MALNRIAKRSFRVITDDELIGLIQKHHLRHHWTFSPFEGCGISKREMVLQGLSQLKGYVHYLDLLKTS
jgi:hypothetical protein